MGEYYQYKTYNSLISSQYPVNWKIVRNKSILSEIADKVGSNSGDYTLLSLTTKGVIIRDLESGKGKFPKEFDTYKIVRKDNLVFCLFDIDETPRTVGIAENKGMITGAYTILSVNPLIAFPKFIYYYYISVDDSKALSPYYSGLRKTVRAERFLRLYIPLPPLSEQEKIVNFLDTKITMINTFLIEKERELSLYKEYIENLIYSNCDGNRITIMKWEESFPEECEIISGRGLFEEVIIKGVKNERFIAVTQDKGLIYKDVDGVNFVTAENKETQKLICPGQFVISLRSFEGGIELSNIRGLVSPAYVVFKLKTQYDNKEMQMYYRFLFKSFPFINRLNTISDSMRDGKSIKFSDIRDFKYPIPSKDVLKEVIKYISIYDLKREAYEIEKDLLNEYKQRLIADVVTGQINVQNL